MWTVLMLLFFWVEPLKEDQGSQNLPKKIDLTLNFQREYKILTYNVWGLPVYLPGHEDDNRFPFIADSLVDRDPDILCLQEIFSVHFRSLNLSKLKSRYHYGSDYDCSQSIVPFVYKDCHGGLATFSKYPILEEKFYPYPVFPGMRWEEKIGAKGFLLTLIDLPYGKVWVVNTHLYAGPDDNDELIRLSQLQYMMKILKVLDTELPLILAGDFNIAHPELVNNKLTFSTKAYDMIQNQWQFQDAVDNYTNSSQLFTIDPDHNKYCDSKEGCQKLDYIFYRGGLSKCISILHNTVEMKGAATLSDHHAFSTVFKLDKLQ